MARFGDYETARELSVRGLTSVYVAQRIAGSGPPTAVIKVLQLGRAAGSPPGAGAVGTTGTTGTAGVAGASSTPGASGAPLASAPQVFVSHPVKDKAVADAVVAALEAAGMSCWIAPRNILPGANWASSIVKGIAESRVMVLVFSENANQSSHIRREVERAVHHDIPIAPMRVEDVMPKGDLEYFLSASHWMDAVAPPLEQHLPRLVQTVKTLLAQQETLGTAATPTTVAAPAAPATPVPAAPADALPTAARAAVAQFLEAARVQQTAAQASRHWAPVYGMGDVTGGAYYATAHFRHSAEGLIERRARLGPAQLHAILSQVVQGLLELQHTLDRPHGDLKPSNVLFRKDQFDAPENVALADPLPTAQLTYRHGTCADIQAVARLLYLLVVGRRTGAPDAPDAGDVQVPWPAEPSPEWAALGRCGQEWRALYNLLADPHPPAAIGLEQAKERIDALRPYRRRRVPVVGVMAGAAVALAAPLCLFYFYTPRLPGTGTSSVPPVPPVPPGNAAAITRPAGVTSSSGPSTVPHASPVTVTTPSGQQTMQGWPGGGRAERSVLDQLMVVKNPANPFKVQVKPQVAPCKDPPGNCLSFTITAERGCYLLLVARDSEGTVSLLVPNADVNHCLFMEAGQLAIPAPDAKYYFPLAPPWGPMWVKAIASTELVELVGTTEKSPPVVRPTTEPTEGYLTGVEALAVARLGGAARRGTDLSKLLEPDEWATAEVELVVTGPNGATPAGITVTRTSP